MTIFAQTRRSWTSVRHDEPGCLRCPCADQHERKRLRGADRVGGCPCRPLTGMGIHVLMFLVVNGRITP